MGRASGERKVGVDTRNLGRPFQSNGTDSAWRDWSVVFRSYAALVHPALKGEMQRVERLPTGETNAALLDDDQVQASTDLYHLLLHSTFGPPLDRVVNAGSAEGVGSLPDASWSQRPSTAPMEIDALQQHGNKKCHTCGRFGHLSKDCWQNKSKSRARIPRANGGKKGKGKRKGKTDKDVCLKCGERGHWAKNCSNPANAIHGLDGLE